MVPPNLSHLPALECEKSSFVHWALLLSDVLLLAPYFNRLGHAYAGCVASLCRGLTDLADSLKLSMPLDLNNTPCIAQV